MSIKEYADQNREWLEELALSGELIPRAMALTVLKIAGESDQRSRRND